MSFHFRPATRPASPVIVGIAGPTKSGKTYSAHRIARGLAQGKPVAMINAEGARGHQYADTFEYLAADIQPPYSPVRYREALKAALEIDPGVVILDSMSHMHDGPGGMLEYHEQEIDRMTNGSTDFKARQRMTWAAWIKPKAEENDFIYEALGAGCHLVFCFRAKPKLKIVRGAEPIDLGLQPISSDRVSFETHFTLMLPAHSKGVPDLAASEMREPFDTMIKAEQLSEETGIALAAWSGAGAAPSDDGRVVAQLLAVAAERDNLEAVKEAIEKHAAKSTGPVHSRWLAQQLARLTEQVTV